MRAESHSFLNAMFTEHSASLEATFFVFTRTTGTKISRWSAVLLHSTNQFFIKAPPMSNYCKNSLIQLLDFAEQLGFAEAFVCVSRVSIDCDEVVEEILNLDFTSVSPRGSLGAEFALLRFQF